MTSPKLLLSLLSLCALALAAPAHATKANKKNKAGATTAGAKAGAPKGGAKGGAGGPASKRNVFTLKNAPQGGPFPSALVHLPTGFRKSGKLNLVVYFHGNGNCISVTVEAKNAPCKKGGPARTAHDLIGQIDKSGVNAAFVAIERAFDAGSASGNLSQAGFFKKMILELLPKIGTLAGRSYSAGNLGKIVIASHSGGYNAAADVATKGGLPIHEVLLFDSIYGRIPDFESWIKGDLGKRRFHVVYTKVGGTNVNSQKVAKDIKAAVSDAGLPADTLTDERTKKDAAFTGEALDAPLVFFQSGVGHDPSVVLWFGKMLTHAGL